MHARNRTWLLGSNPVERYRQRTMSVEGGDGSTFSVDLTSGVLDPRMTFTRFTNATFVNSQGLVQWTKSNLFLSSNSLDSANWSVAGLTTRTSTVDPNGGSDGVFLNEDASTGNHGVRQSGTANVASQYYTCSVYLKAGTNRSIGCIFDNSIAGNVVIFYTLTGNGTVTIPAGSNSTMSGTITKIADTGWYRCSYTIYTTTSTNIFIASAIGTSSGNHSFAGTIGNGIQAWGAQLEMGSVANPLLVTVGSRMYDDPRFDYDPSTLVARGLLIEASGSNGYTQSESLTGLYVDNAILSRTTGTSPSGNTAVGFLPTLANALHRLEATSPPVLSGAVTISVWVKQLNSTLRAGINATGLIGVGAIFSLTGDGSTVAITGTATNKTSSITKYPNNWYRISVTGTYVASSSAYVFMDSSTSTDATGGSYTGVSGEGIYIWGLQIESGAGASSYIPSGASTGTRASESCVIINSNFTSVFSNATEAVLYVQYERPRSQAGTIGHDHVAVGSQYSSGLGLSVYCAASVFYPTTFLWPTGGFLTPGGIASAIPLVNKQAAKWFAANDATNFANGVQGSTANGTGTLNPNMFCVGSHSLNGTSAGRDWLNACIRQIKFWPVALSDSQVIGITAP